MSFGDNGRCKHNWRDAVFLCGMAFRIIVECYAAILEAVIIVFKIYHADDKLKKKITFAKMLPFTETQEQIDGLTNALVLCRTQFVRTPWHCYDGWRGDCY